MIWEMRLLALGAVILLVMLIVSIWTIVTN